jgi:hypothetical protein
MLATVLDCATISKVLFRFPASPDWLRLWYRSNRILKKQAQTKKNKKQNANKLEPFVPTDDTICFLS